MKFVRSQVGGWLGYAGFFLWMLLALILVAGTASTAGAAGVTIDPRLVSVAPGVAMIPGASPPATRKNGARLANVVVVSGPRGALVWNSGVSYRHGLQLQNAIRSSLEVPIRAVIVSHAFQDVLFGWRAFQQSGVPVWMHQGAVDLMQSRCQTCLRSLTALLGTDAMQGTGLASPTRVLVGGSKPGLTGRNIELFDFGKTSGPNDLMLFDHQTGTLLSGPLVFTTRLPQVSGGDIEQWLAALDRILVWPVRTVIPDYGAPGDMADIARTRRYLAQLKHRVIDLLDEQVGLLELAGQGNLAEFSELTDYDVAHPRNLQAVYLQLEKRLFR